ncbi:S26 family signal peptidase [Candidatus Aciduliprofundum boonei]|uniref:Signal peptidase I n=1 Tax=Aciduliprofundum boonei (strain DSM 19572 / T469) TaxID=439481 RepID=D3TB79_ACIB4|nr:S26 family signal peptidase [Candidatus Aciduliprofundum boonei]ADD07814.1 signal peptidase I [Aciduliprofundum boonei T469]HII54478.1 S26 family signal peptidase [Candidatus Aciduliprofundum boonei]
MEENNKGNLWRDTFKDVVISIIIVLVIFLSLYAYAQTWPPIVVIESGSMQHGDLSHIGTIDTGDIVIVKKVYSADDVVSYVEGRMKGYETYGDYGDVIIYKCHGELIIHRAIVYLHWNGKEWKIRGFENGNYPSWLHVTKDYITIDNVGYEHKKIIINLQKLNPNVVGKEGFITMGDHNLARFGPSAYDQSTSGFIPICPYLVNYNMIVGVARGEIPWFGAIKLYLTHTNTEEIPSNTNVNLAISLIVLVAGSVGIDYAIAHREEIKRKLRRLKE